MQTGSVLAADTVEMQWLAIMRASSTAFIVVAILLSTAAVERVEVNVFMKRC